MWDRIKNYLLISLAILFIVAGILAYKFYKDSINKDTLILEKNELMKIKDNEYVQVTEELKTVKQANDYFKLKMDSLSKVINTDKESIRYLNQLVLKYKNEHYEYYDTIPVYVKIGDTIKIKIGDDIVKFQAENTLFKVLGETQIYPKKGYKLDFIGKPFTLDIVLTEDNDGVFKTYIDTHTPDLELLSMNTIVKRKEIGFWQRFEGFVGANVTSRNGFLDLGINYNRIGFKGIVGFDYSNFQINDKSNIFYGLGIYYKLW